MADELPADQSSQPSQPPVSQSDVPRTTHGGVPIVQYQHRDTRLVQRAIREGWNIPEFIRNGLPVHLYQIVTNTPAGGKPPPDFKEQNRLLAAKLLVDMTKVNACVDDEGQPIQQHLHLHGHASGDSVSADERRANARALLIGQLAKLGDSGFGRSNHRDSGPGFGEAAELDAGGVADEGDV